MGDQREKAVIDLVINGQQAQATGRELTKTYLSARKALYDMSEVDPGYAKQKRQVEELMKAQQARIVKIHEEKTAWEKFKSSAGGMVGSIAGGNLVATGIQKLLELGPAVVDRQLKIRDSFADISKAADMTDSEVQDLNNSLKSLDTRTPTEELRNMAVVGGQFGIAKKDMEGFVESADKLNVALGDQFDSAEQVAETTLKLRNTFQDIKSDRIDDDMMRIGNGLNYLEAQGAATAPVMADFSSRIGGVAIPLGLTSGQVLGLSATLQELNVTAERGSSAMTDILAGITKAPAQFAKYAIGVDGAKLSTKQFKDLVNTDLNAAFMAVISGFNQGDTSATGMAAKLADLDIKGNGVMEIFMKLASNTELLTKRQEEGTTALTNTTSITNEFSKKNLELAVNLKKISEWFDSFLENGTLGKFADFVVRATVKVLGLSDASTQLAKGYLDQASKASQLEKATLPLLDRYDQLTKKTKLTKDEQAELKTITAQVASGMPAAVTQFDNYANALGISTTKARELIEAQKEMQRQMKQGAIEEQKQELRNIQFQREQILEKLKNKEEVTVSASGNVTARPLSPADISKMNADLLKLEERRKQALENMVKLEGKAPATKPATPDKPKPNGLDGTQETEEERKAREKKEKAKAKADKKELSDAQRHEDEYARLLADARERTAKTQDNEFLKDQLAFGEHYKKLYDLAGGNQQKMDEVTTQMYQELDAIQKEENDRQYKEAKKHSDQMLKLALKDLETKKTLALADIQNRVAAGGITKDQGKLLEYQAEQVYLASKEVLYQTHYGSLKKLAGDNKTALAEIAQGSADVQAAIDAEQTQNESDQATARQDIRQSDLDHERAMHEQKMRFAQEEKEFKRQMLSEITADLINDWTGTLQGYKDFWSEASVVQKVALVASKAYALAEIGIQLARQLMLINTAAAMADSVTFGVGGLAIRAKGYAIAIGSAALQTAAVLKAGATSVPAFEFGGFSDEEPSGYTNGPTYYTQGNFIAGEKGREWIMSAPMLKNPVMANLAGALQALQVSGQWRNLSLPSAGAGGGSGTASTGGNSDMSLALLQAIHQQLQANNVNMEKISRRPQVYNRVKIREADEYEDEITAETSL